MHNMKCNAKQHHKTQDTLKYIHVNLSKMFLVPLQSLSRSLLDFENAGIFFIFILGTF